MEPKEGKKLTDLTDSDLNSLYNSGPELTVSFIKYLIDTIEDIKVTVKKQTEQIKELKSIISKDSSNSHKPPSSDGLKKKKKKVIKNLRKKSKKKSGGQKGHPGTNLKISDNPDVIEYLPVEKCNCCNSKEQVNVIGHKRRQTVDVQITKRITEYQAEISECSRCGTITTAVFPSEVTQEIQYGSTVKSLIIYLRTQNFIPTERLAQMLADVFDIPLSEGTIINTTRKCSRILESFDNNMKDKLITEPVVMFDESGIRIKGSLHWLHSASTSLYTYYFPHKKRGKIAMNEMGILPFFKGTAIHDAWQSYFEYACKHGLCNAHHLRDLIFIHEEIGQQWAKKMIKLLLEIKEKVDKEKAKNRMLNAKLIQYYENRYKRIIRSGLKENPQPVTNKKRRGRKKKGKILCLLERLKIRLHEVLAFMYDYNIPFDNNQAERDIRMAKLQQKISGCFRSMEGARDFFRIRSYLSTLRKHKKNIMAALKNLFQTGFFSWCFD